MRPSFDAMDLQLHELPLPSRSSKATSSTTLKFTRFHHANSNHNPTISASATYATSGRLSTITTLSAYSTNPAAVLYASWVQQYAADPSALQLFK